MLECRIFKSYENFNLDADFLMRGNRLGILGASGDGKSLSLKIIAGLIKPDYGLIKMDEKILYDSKNKIFVSPQERRIGYLFQDAALFPNFTNRKNILLAKKDNKVNLDEIIKQLKINDILDKYPNSISFGQKQRVALARIMVNKPDILLLDEPFSGLDQYLKEDVMDLVENIITNHNLKIILVSHNKDEIYRLCEEVVVLDKGKTSPNIDKYDLFTNPKNISQAKLIGIRNFSKVIRLDKDYVYLKNWDIKLKVEDGFKADLVAIKSSDISLSDQRKEGSFKIGEYRLYENIDHYTLICSRGDEKSYNLKIDVEKSYFKKLDQKNLYINIDREKLLAFES